MVIPSNVTSIGNGALYRCRSLSSVVISDGVTSIGDGAFSVCLTLSSVVIPDSMTIIVNGAFKACSSSGSSVECHHAVGLRRAVRPTAGALVFNKVAHAANGWLVSSQRHWPSGSVFPVGEPWNWWRWRPWRWRRWCFSF